MIECIKIGLIERLRVNFLYLWIYFIYERFNLFRYGLCYRCYVVECSLNGLEFRVWF